MKALIVVLIVCWLVAGCTTPVPLQERKLPVRPAAYHDDPKALNASERKLCDMASQRKLQGVLRELPGICRKAQWNFWGWTYLKRFVAYVWRSIHNRDG